MCWWEHDSGTLHDLEQTLWAWLEELVAEAEEES